MPIPQPNPRETRNDFIDRCMSDPVMVEDYPDEEQRLAVCNQQKANTMNEFITVPLEIKTLKDREFNGHGSIFGNVDFGNDVVLPGAFKRTLAEHKSNDSLPIMLWMHDPSRVPGKWLDMQEDKTGLFTDGVIAKTELGDEIHTLLGMKAVRGLSIGYITRDHDYDDNGIRLIKDVDLFEVSIVSIPMNPKAQIAHVKSRLSKNGEYVPTGNEIAELKRNCEKFFRTKGFSKNLAKMYVGNLFKDQTSAMPDDPGVMPTDDELLAAALEELESQNMAGEMPVFSRELDKYIHRMSNNLTNEQINLHPRLRK